MAKMIIDAPNTCKECMDMGLACGMVHKDFDTARNANCPLNILPEGPIFAKDEVLSILKDLRISMDATASDLQYKIDKIDSLQGNVIKNYCDGCENAYLCYGVATNSCKTYQYRKQEDLKKNGRDM